MPSVPELVTLHVWGVRTGRVPAALRAMAFDRRPLSHQPGLTFAKLLGTGAGRTFTPADADPRHWAILACWDSTDAAQAFEHSSVVRRWRAQAQESLRFELRPVSSRGLWSRQEPFGRPGRAGPAAAAATPMAALTRARIRPRMWRAFWSSVPAVSQRLHQAPGLLFAIGLGEAPLGLQGTFSVWSGATALDTFAYASPEHREAISRTRRLGWYSEELFARFRVIATEGTYRGTAPAVPLVRGQHT